MTYEEFGKLVAELESQKDAVREAYDRLALAREKATEEHRYETYQKLSRRWASEEREYARAADRATSLEYLVKFALHEESGSFVHMMPPAVFDERGAR